MQKYRADVSEAQADGAIVWSARWMGGPTVSKVDNCRLENLSGNMRRTVYVTGEPDTWFSIPAACKIAGCRVKGIFDPRRRAKLGFSPSMRLTAD